MAIDIHETPVKSRQTSQSSSRSNRLEESRSAVLEDLGRIDEVNLDWFIQSIFHSPVDARTIEQVQSELGKSWAVSEFKGEPKKKKENENTSFGPLVDMFDRVMDAVKKRLPDCAQTTQLKLCPHRTPLSHRTNYTRPDAIFELVSEGSIINDKQSYWYDIAAVVEVKNNDSDSDFRDDVRKVIWSLHHIFRNDDRRRCAFGITIENTTTRLWWACRAGVIVTESFDFFETQKPLIQAFSALGFAGRTELGYDPTIVLMTGKYHTPQYQYKLGAKTFQTTKVLSNFGADCLRGRGTRVYEAYDIDNYDHTPVVLKDVWIDSDRDPEHAVLEKILEGLPDNAKERRHFMTTLHHGYAQVNGKDDDTLMIMMKNQTLPPDSTPLNIELFNSRHPANSRHKSDQMYSNKKSESTGLVPSTLKPKAMVSPNATKYQKFTARKHYRVVFKEIGCPVHDMDNLSDVFEVLLNALEALAFVHSRKYVHRDISSGNILAVAQHGRISDFEYAKKMNSTSAHELKTGTRQFMATEVHELRYAFLPEPEPKIISFVQLYSDAKQQDEKTPIFRYNLIHDLESLWWIAVWSVFCRELNPEPEDFKASNRSLNAAILFPDEGNQIGRWNAFRSGDFKLMAKSLPLCLKEHGSALEALREVLVLAYRAVEKNLSDSVDSCANHSVLEDLRGAFKDGLQELKKLSHGIFLKVGYCASTKRRNTDTATDESQSKKAKN